MLYVKSFKNYDEFKNIFGMAEHGKSRKNKILLSLYKNKALWRKSLELGNFYPFSITTMPELKSWCMNNLAHFSTGEYRVYVLGRLFFSDTFETDKFCGICEDSDISCFRYIRHDGDSQRVYKMKAGRLLKKLIDENPFGRYLNESVVLWLCGEFAADWIAHATSALGSYTLHTGDTVKDFDGIYGGFRYRGDFHSCMMNMNENIGSFYADAVDATAAWLTDSDGYMVARCVIFNDVMDCDTGDTFRLAERQYASDLDESLMKILILKLQAKKLIDGYKQIGASCHSPHSFVSVDGESLADRDFKIRCRLSPGDPCPYMDSFKYYDYNNDYAYNSTGYGTTDNLENTDGIFRQKRIYSEMFDEWFDENEVTWVESRNSYIPDDYVVRNARVYDDDGGYEYYACYEDDCIYIDGHYYYAGYDGEDYKSYGIRKCPCCNDYFLYVDRYHSELTGEDYDCESCKEYAENQWHTDNGKVRATWDGKWYDKDKVIGVYCWSYYGYVYRRETVCIDDFNEHVERNEATEYDGDYYIDEMNLEGEPVHLMCEMAVD